MVQQVLGPDGVPVEFPDGMSDEDMTAALRKHFPKATVSSAGPNGVPLPQGVGPQVTVPQTQDQGLGLWRGLKIPLDNASTAVEAGLNKIGVPMDRINGFLKLPSSQQARDQDIQYIKDQRAQGRTPGTAGELVGSGLASIPVLAATRNPFLGGAAMGALSSEAPDLAGVGTDAATGALLGKAGELGTRALGAAIAPQLSGPVNRLLAKGVRLTPGQMVGGKLKKIEDAATSGFTPFVDSAQHRSLDDANRALVNDGLKVIGKKLPDDVATGHDAINYFQDSMDHAYDSARSNLTVNKDPQWVMDTTSLKNLASNMEPKYSDKFNKQLDKIEGKMGWPATVSGHTFKDLEEGLGKEVKDWGGKNASGPEDRLYADSIMQLQQHFRELAARSDPQYAKALAADNEAYSHLARLESAAANTKDGIVSPAQYRNAVVQGDNSIRHRMSAGGNAFNQQTASDMEKVLPRQLPESGTVPRAIVNSLTGAALFGGAEAHHLVPSINPMFAGVGATMLAPYTRMGGAAFRALVRQRGPKADAARAALQAASPVVGDVNAGQQVRNRDDNLAGVQ